MNLFRSKYPNTACPAHLPALRLLCSPNTHRKASPGFMEWTMSLRMSRGAFLPGIRAVVMMMSTSLACSRNRAICNHRQGNQADPAGIYTPYITIFSSGMRAVMKMMSTSLACSRDRAICEHLQGNQVAKPDRKCTLPHIQKYPLI